ncbi:MAG: hypothetical protein GF353_10815 [Candidatus Lokiarchaeota archaeon]|nr:hypothetical protein [Candidatus Lokiarchaeota archaeon]
MNDINEQIKQLELLLQNISKELKSLQPTETLVEKQNQLHAIENTIQKLTKDNVPIPNDLRELKLKLVYEIEQLPDIEEAKKRLALVFKDYQEIFQPAAVKKRTLKRRKRRKRRKKLGRRIEVIDLLKAEIIPKDTVIFRTYKGIRYEAQIDRNGKIVTTFNGRVQMFDSPSAAAVTLTNLSQNGWKWWFVSIDGKKRELDYYRKEYIKNEAKRRR